MLMSFPVYMVCELMVSVKLSSDFLWQQYCYQKPSQTRVAGIERVHSNSESARSYRSRLPKTNTPLLIATKNPIISTKRSYPNLDAYRGSVTFA